MYWWVCPNEEARGWEGHLFGGKGVGGDLKRTFILEEIHMVHCGQIANMLQQVQVQYTTS